MLGLRNSVFEHRLGCFFQVLGWDCPDFWNIFFKSPEPDAGVISAITGQFFAGIHDHPDLVVDRDEITLLKHAGYLIDLRFSYRTSSPACLLEECFDDLQKLQ